MTTRFASCLITGKELPKEAFREAELALDVYDVNAILKHEETVNLSYFEGIYQLLIFLTDDYFEMV